MPHTDVIPTSASTASTGTGIRYIGEHAYAFSGTVSVAATTVTALSFTTGAGYIVGKFYLNYNSTGFGAGERIGYTIELNGEEVVDAVYGENVQSPTTAPYDVQLALPPLTLCEVKLTTSDNSGIGMGMVFTGRVYGAE